MPTTELLECGHPGEHYNKNYGCELCDAGARPPNEPLPVRLPPKVYSGTEATAVVHNRDCIAGMAEMLADNSIDLTVTSIPFEELFTYSGKLEDVGNNGSTIDIAPAGCSNMRFVAEQLYRVHKPGTNCCIHIQQLLAYKNQHGFIGRRDFRGAMIDVFSAGGFNFAGEFVIQKNPQAMAQRINLHSLMFITGKRNANNLAPCPNDYVLIFHKPGECADPVPALYDSRLSPGGWISTEEWIRDAHGIWTDILEIDILDGARQARESDTEKHVCPLQLEVIRRLVRLYSNPAANQPGVLVLDPFMGIGSTAWVCLDAPSPTTGLTVCGQRNVIGFELKESYHANALRNIEKARKLVEASQKQDVMLF